MEVHRQLHRGYLESIYCEALAIEFELRRIPFEPQVGLHMEYKGKTLTGLHRIDFVCFSAVVIEVKAMAALTPAHEAQLLNYLAISKLRRGLLLNFGGASLDYKRRVL